MLYYDCSARQRKEYVPVNTQSELLGNLHRLHTTELGSVRIKRNLSLDTDDIVRWCRAEIESENTLIERRGKNFYITSEGCIITVNAHSYTVITAHKIKEEQKS